MDQSLPLSTIGKFRLYTLFGKSAPKILVIISLRFGSKTLFSRYPLAAPKMMHIVDIELGEVG
jgi:hypothetical protein